MLNFLVYRSTVNGELRSIFYFHSIYFSESDDDVYKLMAIEDYFFYFLSGPFELNIWPENECEFQIKSFLPLLFFYLSIGPLYT